MSAARRVSALALVVLVAFAVASATTAAERSAPALPRGLIVFPDVWPVGLSGEGSAVYGADLRGHSYRLSPIATAGSFGEPSWSPDGTAFAYAESSASVGFTSVDIFLARLHGKALGSIPHAEWPSWAPSGTQLAFFAPPRLELRGASVLTVANLDGSAPRSFGPGDGPIAWSRDGRRIAFGGRGITVVDVEAGTSSTILAGVSTLGGFDWSPDGSRFVFVGGATLPAPLELAAADGSSRHALAAGAEGLAPAWSPDGSLIAFESGSGLRVVAPDGSAARLVYRGSVGSTFQDGLDWQPVPHPELLRGLPPCEIVGDAAHQRLSGSRFQDAIVGTAGRDVMTGGAGADSMFGQGGDDSIDGGSGNDALAGGGGNDRIVGGAGRNAIDAGRGADTILVRNGERDVVDCGPGVDIAYVDRLDVARHCEHVRLPSTGRP